MRLATITQKQIEDSIYQDQGTAYRKVLQEILPKIEDAYRASEDGYRSHLGASLIGRDCAFELWLGYRWTEKAKFPERILRLFNRGHLEEAHFLAMIISAGLEVWYETEEGGQFRFSDVDGHFGSALDGIIKIPELEGAPAYTEFKTHNDKSFKALIKGEGVQNSKYEHYVQMQVCMHKYNLKYGVYFAINKNDDTIHIEIINYDEVTAKGYIQRARGIIYAEDAPPRISNKVSFWKCKFCNKADICHRKKLPDINCRTCAYSSPMKDGTWSCSKFGCTLTKELAQEGCAKHIYNPHLIPSVELIRIHPEGYLELRLESGKIIEHGEGHIASKDLEI